VGQETILFYRVSGEWGFLSNLYLAPVVFEGHLFDCAERAYQFGKAADRATARWIVSAPTPSLCAQAAHGLFGWQMKQGWNDNKVQRMEQVLWAKFAANPALARKLLETGDKALVEESNCDAFWGTGRPNARGETKGKNMLGLLLMETRFKLAAEGRR
jgi:ribA/ribD-fused uncharacterized protein